MGESLELVSLSAVQRCITLRVVAHEHLAKGRLEGLDVPGEVLAILELELVLPALLGGTGERVALGRRIAEDGLTEPLVHEDAGLFPGYARGGGGLEGVVDHLFGRGRPRGLLGGP